MSLRASEEFNYPQELLRVEGMLENSAQRLDALRAVDPPSDLLPKSSQMPAEDWESFLGIQGGSISAQALFDLLPSERELLARFNSPSMLCAWLGSVDMGEPRPGRPPRTPFDDLGWDPALRPEPPERQAELARAFWRQRLGARCVELAQSLPTFSFNWLRSDERWSLDFSKAALTGVKPSRAALLAEAALPALAGGVASQVLSQMNAPIWAWLALIPTLVLLTVSFPHALGPLGWWLPSVRASARVVRAAYPFLSWAQARWIVNLSNTGRFGARSGRLASGMAQRLCARAFERSKAPLPSPLAWSAWWIRQQLLQEGAPLGARGARRCAEIAQNFHEHELLEQLPAAPRAAITRL